MICEFWNDVTSDCRIIPNNYMDVGEQIDCLIRLLVFVFIVCLLFDLNLILYLILLFIIIFLCYIKGNMYNQKEHFSYKYPPQNENYKSKNSRSVKNTKTESQLPRFKRATEDNQGDMIEDVNYNPFAYDAKNLDVNDPYYTSNNYKIVGGPNPKTLIPPVITPPIMEQQYWKSNNLTVNSNINDNRNIDVYQSGYEVSTMCGDNSCPKVNNNFDYIKMNSNYKTVKQNQELLYDTQRENMKYHRNYLKEHPKNIRENFTLDDTGSGSGSDSASASESSYYDKPKIQNIGYVNKKCGYNKNQFEKSNLPVNVSLGKCQQGLKDYNKDLFTQIIQPGVYTVNQVNEPINSNIGISFEQQFEPLTYNVDEFGTVNFTQHDPRDPNFKEKDNILKYDDNEVIEPITPYNVYDPRFSGYGTSYRSYTDDNLGQVKFFYDDINSVRMPNYIVRSKIDFADFADTYGPMENSKGNIDNTAIRALANQKFLDDSLQFRTGMQERLMRKVNTDAWQQRYKPIYKTSQRMMGGKML